jgi:hypothetical protein
MCVDCQRRAVTNPLRVLDCKVPADQPIIDTLPVIADSLDEASKAHFAAVTAALDAAGVPYTRNHRLVRGLDYYTRTTFEFTHGGLGAQNALLGGGRYDGLSEASAGPKRPASALPWAKTGWCSPCRLWKLPAPQVADAFIAPLGESLNPAALVLARELRHQGPVDRAGRRQLPPQEILRSRRQDRPPIVILGEDELQSGILTVKTFATGIQTKVPRAELAVFLSKKTGRRVKDTGSARFLGNLERTHLCGDLRAANAGQQVVLMGWVNRRRDHGNLIFLDLRDRSGIAQIVLDKELTPDGHAKGEQVRPEYVVAAVGKVRLREGRHQSQDAHRRDRDRGHRAARPQRHAPGAVSRPRKKPSRTRKSASNTATWTCAARRCSATSACATTSRWPSARASASRAFLRSKRPSSPSPPPRARAIFWCPAACIPASSTRCRSRRRSSSRSS